MLNNICDLHVHSYYSDGTDSPEQILDKAQELGLGAVALSDHNTSNGLPEFIKLAKQKGIQAVAGVEFSTDWHDCGKELHILALFVPESAYQAVNEYTKVLAENKRKSNINLINSLKNAGYDIDYDQMANKTKGNINRVHIATELMEKGYVPTVKEAFNTVLSVAHGYYVPPERLEVFKTIEFINSIGAVSVLAHPFHNLDLQQLKMFLDKAVQHGLDAMETHYSEFTPEMFQQAKQTAEQYGLLQSGGSDYHGKRKPHIQLALGMGNLGVPVEFYNALKSASEKKRPK